VPEKPVPIVRDDQIKAMLDACAGRDFVYAWHERSGTKAAWDRFDKQVDPDGLLPSEERVQRAKRQHCHC
jgi:hypothetical protein